MMHVIDNMKEVLEQNVDIDSNKYIKTFKRFYTHLLQSGIHLNESVIIGLILHLACALERVLKIKKSYREF